MAFGPGRSCPPHDTVTKEEPAQPVASPREILDHVTARATQIAHAFLGGRRDGDRGQLTGPVQPGQSSGVAAVGLDPIAPPLLSPSRRPSPDGRILGGQYWTRLGSFHSYVGSVHRQVNDPRKCGCRRSRPFHTD